MCGRFKTTQVRRIVIDLPQNIFHIQLPFWKKFLVAFLIIYGSTFFAIDTTIAGTSYNTPETFYEISQGEPIIKKEKQKKKHKRKKSWTYQHTTKLDIQNIVLGGFGLEPIIEDLWLNNPDKCSPNLSYLDKNPDTSNNKNKITSAENGKPESPLPKPLTEKTAYILPAALALRNPFSKKKKA